MLQVEPKSYQRVLIIPNSFLKRFLDGSTHRRRAQAFRAFTVKAHFIVHSNFIVHSEAKKRREERGKKEKRGKPNKTNIDTETVIVSDFYGIDKPSLVSIRGSVC